MNPNGYEDVSGKDLRRIQIITEEINRMCAVSKLEGWNSAIEVAAKVAEDISINGEYKDCPAAWMNTASKILADKIKELKK